MVPKSASATPFSALALCEPAERGGVPKGAFSCATSQTTAIDSTEPCLALPRPVGFKYHEAIRDDKASAVRPARQYDKGERRFKHVGTGRSPVIAFERGDPKMWIGKCPSTLTQPDREVLLNEAIAASNGDRELAPPKKLYVVHEGAIYEAQTSDRGRSYHGYPYRGKLSPSLISALRAMAKRKNCLEAFEQWLKDHIEPHGHRG
jgi:hypothetical protein